jgi:uracil-DNA glycosylase
VAASVGPVRLIDNAIFGPPGASPERLLQLALAAAPVLDTRARIPGLEADTLRRRIESCRDCAAISSILLPPREFLVKYLKRDYSDLNLVRVLIIGRDSAINPENFLYRNPDSSNRFASAIFELLGVKNFSEFKQHAALTDALRCHASGSRVPEKGLEHCARHLREELKLFVNLDTIIILGIDAYLQFQRLILSRRDQEFKPFHQLLGNDGWAKEEVRIPFLGDRLMRIFYCHHPTYEYKHSPSLGALLA